MPSQTTRTRKAKPPAEEMRVLEQPEIDESEVLSLTSGEDIVTEWFDAFELLGTTYQMRTSAPPNVTVKFLHMWRKGEHIFAQDYLLDEMLAPGAYDALMNYSRLRPEHVTAVSKMAADVLFGRTDKLIPKA